MEARNFLMQSDNGNVLDQCADAASSAKFLKSAEEQLKRLGAEATYLPQDDTNPNCGIRYRKPGQSGDISLVGDGNRMPYQKLTQLEWLIESIYTQRRLNELQLRMAQIGWRPFVQGKLIYVDKEETGSSEAHYSPTYEGLYTLENDLRRAEMRHMILAFWAQMHLAGKDVEASASIEDDGVCIEDVATRKPVKLCYSDPKAPNKLNTFLQELIIKLLTAPHTPTDL